MQLQSCKYTAGPHQLFIAPSRVPGQTTVRLNKYESITIRGVGDDIQIIGGVRTSFTGPKQGPSTPSTRSKLRFNFVFLDADQALSSAKCHFDHTLGFDTNFNHPCWLHVQVAQQAVQNPKAIPALRGLFQFIRRIRSSARPEPKWAQLPKILNTIKNHGATIDSNLFLKMYLDETLDAMADCPVRLDDYRPYEQSKLAQYGVRNRQVLFRFRATLAEHFETKSEEQMRRDIFTAVKATVDDLCNDKEFFAAEAICAAFEFPYTPEQSNKLAAARKILLSI